MRAATLRVVLAMLPLMAAFSDDSGQLIPFVGCASDGQAGPVDAPKAKTVRLPITARQASKLAYYQSAGTFGLGGVLAPRGWHCFGLYGSGGDALYVAPQPLSFSDSFQFSGPAVVLRHRLGETMGRYDVGIAIAQVFPKHRDFVQHLVDADLMDPNKVPSGPYPADRLTYRSDEIVEYQTSPGKEGLGTELLKISADPISGVAMLIGRTPDLLLLAVRLPRDLTDLAPAIIYQGEREGKRFSLTR